MNLYRFYKVILFFSIGLTACVSCIPFHSGTLDNLDSINHPGLYVAPNGTLMYGGKPFRGIGVNYFDAFSRTLKSAADTSYIAGLRYLASRHIPFIRFMACGYWPVNWELYLNNKVEYFKRLDAFIHTAEKYKIGLIPNLFWHSFSIPALVGESINQWGNPGNETIAFMKNYTKEVVTRYRDSPAIWGWEFSNEMNNRVDLPKLPPVLPSHLGVADHRTRADRLKTEDMVIALREFAETVRKYDSSRIIISGNTIPRPGAYHLYKLGSWGEDSKEKFDYMLALQNPNPINVLSIHIYPHHELKWFKDKPVTIKDMVREAMCVSEREQKPLFIGEFGASRKVLGAEAMEHQKFNELLDAIERQKVPLAALWVFDFSRQDRIWNLTPHNDRRYQLDAIVKLNRKLYEYPPG